MARKGWIDFKELRDQLDFARVLHLYEVELRQTGKAQLMGYCPLPNHNGKRNSESFSVNLEKKVFHCFGCGSSGNIIEFAVLMEGCEKENGGKFLEVAKKLQNHFVLGELGIKAVSKAKQISETVNSTETSKAKEELPEENTDRPIVVNAPLDFELKNLDSGHEYLLSRGFKRETIEHFGAGYCKRGLMKGRIAIPIQNEQGELLGYAGRIVDDSKIGEGIPKYLFPGKREHAGFLHEFRKSEIVYNSNILQPETPLSDLIVVEGFTDLWWIWQNGFENIVGLLGSSCSDKQAEFIVSTAQQSGRVWIMTDGNKAGVRCAISTLEKVSPHRFCRWIKLEDDMEPTDLQLTDLKMLFPELKS